jgi:hypothetical protein
MRNHVSLVALVALGAVLPGLGIHAEEKGLRELMQQKLHASQRALEGIALGDFDKIVKSGEELVLVSKATQWKVIKTPRFDLYSNEFRRTAESMIDAAKEKSLDGAALSYVDLTLNCVKCHKYVRESRMSRLDRR